MKQVRHIILAFALAVLLYSCQNATTNQTGSEYMPDMAHSAAVEANTYNFYFANTWDDESVLPLSETSKARKPVKGTVPRSMGDPDRVLDEGVVSPYGSVPYHYEDSEDGRAAATAEITENPFPITVEGMKAGSALYATFCATCHGSGGKNGDGIYASGIYPLAPANLVGDSTIAYSSPGRYYHAIMYGKNAMGAYKDKLSYEERWQVIHFIRSLQAKEYEATYDAMANTLNTYGVPKAQWIAMNDTEEINQMPEGEAHSDDDEHEHGAGGDHSHENGDNHDH
ncbi:MAG: c-type cytochrome [Bacteroidota bacterium]